MRRVARNLSAALLALLVCATGAGVRAQKKTEAGERGEKRRDVRSVTIPVTVRLPEKGPQGELRYLDDLEVFEDGERQEVLAARGAGRTPMTLAVLIQDDLVSSIGNEIRGIADFIRKLPPGSRVMVGYLRSGPLQMRQQFPVDVDRLSTETGVRAFFHRTRPPVSLDKFIRDVDMLLSRQFALTYLSTHAAKGFHKVRVVADLGEGEIYYPSGYTR